jgi:uncharacterized protein YfaP (DUF2135 family)
MDTPKKGWKAAKRIAAKWKCAIDDPKERTVTMKNRALRSNLRNTLRCSGKGKKNNDKQCNKYWRKTFLVYFKK